MQAEELFRALRVDFLGSGNHHCREGWLQLQTCPFCGSQKYHLGYNIERRFFSCWKCGPQPAVKVLYALGASRELVRAFFKDLDKIQFKHQEHTGTLKEPKFRGPLRSYHRKYLRSRGFNPEELVHYWDLEGIGPVGPFAYRLYIPVIRHGDRVSWTTRSIGKHTLQRYISAKSDEESFPHKHCLYGEDLACHCVVVVEGPADAWRIGPGAVALFGTAFTTPQVKALSRFPFRFILFDNEPKAQRQARALAESLSCFPGSTTILQCKAKDPGEMGAKEMKELRSFVGLARKEYHGP